MQCIEVHYKAECINTCIIYIHQIYKKAFKLNRNVCFVGFTNSTCVSGAGSRINQVRPGVWGSLCGDVWGLREGACGGGFSSTAFDITSKSSSKKATQVIRKRNFPRKIRDDNIRKRKSESRTHFSLPPGVRLPFSTLHD